ncbi:MAG: carbon-nitrogen hydrolase family protein [Flavobacteriales bacterium]|nr:carbon-nitrogen hydrolase family protein [Flavobacteriales bacterium]
MQVKIALVQLDIVPMEPLKNLARMEEHAAKAKAAGAQLVVFPEDAVCGPLQGQTAFVPYAAEYLARMQALALRLGVDIVPGSWTVAENGVLYNRTFYINADGTLAGWYSKVNLWATEKLHIAPGPGVSVFPTRFGLVGLIICWDISFPEMFIAMRHLGARLVISPTYWSFPKKALRSEELLDDEVLLIDSLCTTRAFENDILFAYCNAAGELQNPDGSLAVLSGRSQVTHPLQKVLVQAPGNAEEMLLCDAVLDAPPAAAAAVA